MTQERTRRRIFSPNHSFYCILLREKKKSPDDTSFLFNIHSQINVDIRPENKRITAAWNISWDLFYFRGRRRIRSCCLVNMPSVRVAWKLPFTGRVIVALLLRFTLKKNCNPKDLIWSTGDLDIIAHKRVFWYFTERLRQCGGDLGDAVYNHSKTGIMLTSSVRGGIIIIMLFIFRLCVYVIKAHFPSHWGRSSLFRASAAAVFPPGTPGTWVWKCAVVLHGLCHDPKSKGIMRVGPMTLAASVNMCAVLSTVPQRAFSCSLTAQSQSSTADPAFFFSI